MDKLKFKLPKMLDLSGKQVLLREIDEIDCEEFKVSLCSSMIEQYSDYVGFDKASKLVDKLSSEPGFYSCSDDNAIGGFVDEKLVSLSVVNQGRSDNEYYLSSFYVIEAFRGKGLGSAMLELLLACDSTLSVHVSVHRPDLAAMYKKAGFELVTKDLVELSGFPFLLQRLVANKHASILEENVETL